MLVLLLLMLRSVLPLRFPPRLKFPPPWLLPLFSMLPKNDGDLSNVSVDAEDAKFGAGRTSAEAPVSLTDEEENDDDNDDDDDDDDNEGEDPQLDMSVATMSPVGARVKKRTSGPAAEDADDAGNAGSDRNCETPPPPPPLGYAIELRDRALETPDPDAEDDKDDIPESAPDKDGMDDVFTLVVEVIGGKICELGTMGE
jgi:hypothetical protein